MRHAKRTSEQEITAKPPADTGILLRLRKTVGGPGITIGNVKSYRHSHLASDAQD